MSIFQSEWSKQTRHHASWTVNIRKSVIVKVTKIHRSMSLSIYHFLLLTAQSMLRQSSSIGKILSVLTCYAFIFYQMKNRRICSLNATLINIKVSSVSAHNKIIPLLFCVFLCNHLLLNQILGSHIRTSQRATEQGSIRCNWAFFIVPSRWQPIPTILFPATGRCGCGYPGKVERLIHQRNNSDFFLVRPTKTMNDANPLHQRQKQRR